MVSINCGAIPENLLESELFGHVKGAFTGAVQTRIGRFEQANGGTIFLDEIGNMPLALQVKLLRVLQEREFERVGGNSTVKVDVRIIAATSSNLEQMVKDGTFREDLYYRLNVIPIDLPPLRERREDIPLLVQRFIEHFCETHKLDLKTISPHVLKVLMAYDWPGNVRQLENIVERMVALTANRPAILPADLPGEIQNRDSLSFVPLIEIPEGGISFQDVVTDMERELIVQVLEQNDFSINRTAEQLKISRFSLRNRMRRLNILGAEGYTGDVKYEGLEEALQMENAFVHLYGKKQTKPGRKMGHITIMNHEKQDLLYKSKKIKRTLIAKS